MGGSGSKFVRSTPGDSLHHLQWSLEEKHKVEQNVQYVKQLIEAYAKRMEGGGGQLTSGAIHGGEGSTPSTSSIPIEESSILSATLATDELKSSGVQLIADPTPIAGSSGATVAGGVGVGVGVGVGSGDVGFGFASDFPFDFDVARAVLAEVRTVISSVESSRLVALPTENEKHRKEREAKESEIFSSAMEEQKRLVPATRVFAAAAVEESSRISKTLTSLSASHLSSDPSSSAVSAPKGKSWSAGAMLKSSSTDLTFLLHEVISKYLYLDHFLFRLVASTEHTHKLKCEMDEIVRAKGRKLSIGIGGEARLNQYRFKLGEKLKATTASLESSLLNFDRSRIALRWMMNDYDLLVAKYKVLSILHQSRSTIEFEQQKSSDVRSVEVEQSMNLLQRFIVEFQQVSSELDSQFHRNDRESLSIGMCYLDRNLNGRLEPSDVPEFSAITYNTLDVEKKGYFTVAGLQKAIDQLSESLHQTQNQITDKLLSVKQTRSTPSDIKQVYMDQHENEMEALRGREKELKLLMMAIYRYFHTAFAATLFGKLESDFEASSEEVDQNRFIQILEHIENEAKRDPLAPRPEHEMKIKEEMFRAATEMAAAHAHIKLLPTTEVLMEPKGKFASILVRGAAAATAAVGARSGSGTRSESGSGSAAEQGGGREKMERGSRESRTESESEPESVSASSGEIQGPTAQVSESSGATTKYDPTPQVKGMETGKDVGTQSQFQGQEQETTSEWAQAGTKPTMVSETTRTEPVTSESQVASGGTLPDIGTGAAVEKESGIKGQSESESQRTNEDLETEAREARQ